MEGRDLLSAEGAEDRIDELRALAEKRPKVPKQKLEPIAVGADFNDPRWAVRVAADNLAEVMLGRMKPTKDMFAVFAATIAAMFGRGRGVPLVDLKKTELALGSADLAVAFGDVLRKVLIENFRTAAASYKLVARPVSFADFRPHTIIPASDLPNMLRVDEHGEFKSGYLADKGETASLATYGRIIPISRTLLMNDELRQIGTLIGDAARRLVEFANSTFFSTTILKNSGLGATMADGVVQMNAAHANIASAGALSATTLGSARALVRAQTTAEGQKLNAGTAYLLVSPASETLAEALVATLPVGSMKVIADANLSGTRFYCIADPSVLPAFVYGTLLDNDLPRVVTEYDWHTGGLKTRVSYDFGALCLDHRGIATGAGA